MNSLTHTVGWAPALLVASHRQLTEVGCQTGICAIIMMLARHDVILLVTAGDKHCRTTVASPCGMLRPCALWHVLFSRGNSLLEFRRGAKAGIGVDLCFVARLFHTREHQHSYATNAALNVG